MLLTMPHGLRPVGLVSELAEVRVTTAIVAVGSFVRAINCAWLEPARSAIHTARAVDVHILADKVPKNMKAP